MGNANRSSILDQQQLPQQYRLKSVLNETCPMRIVKVRKTEGNSAGTTSIQGSKNSNNNALELEQCVWLSKEKAETGAKKKEWPKAQ